MSENTPASHKDLAESAVQGILWHNDPSNPTFATRSIHPLLALHHQAKDIVFRFIIEYSSLRDFYGPLGNMSIFTWGFFKNDILVCVETWD
jgi:hypothetical protein